MGDKVDADVAVAYGLLADFREGFAEAHNGVTMGVRSMVQTVGAPVVVSQRLKRAVTILDKLDREQNMKVTRMQDIAGSRAILPDEHAVRSVLARMRTNRWEIKSVDDYVAAPKKTGYRAVHVVVVRDGHMVEVQLRTERQHLWASTVERFSGRPGFERLKDGEGEQVAVDFFRVTAEIMILQDAGLRADTTMMKEYESLRAALHELTG